MKLLNHGTLLKNLLGAPDVVTRTSFPSELFKATRTFDRGPTSTTREDPEATRLPLEPPLAASATFTTLPPVFCLPLLSAASALDVRPPLAETPLPPLLDPAGPLFRHPECSPRFQGLGKFHVGEFRRCLLIPRFKKPGCLTGTDGRARSSHADRHEARVPTAWRSPRDCTRKRTRTPTAVLRNLS